MGFDRALSKAVLDAGLDVATEGGDKAALAERLRGIVSATEAKGRTRAHVARTWVDPAPAAAGAVRWAVDHRELDPGHTLLHFGALLATAPVVGDVAAACGALLHRDNVVDLDHLERVLKPVVREDGGRKTVANVVDTLRSIGVLLGDRRRPLGARPALPKALAAWLLHVVLVSRGQKEVDVAEVRTAPELRLLGRRPTGIAAYPLLDLHQRGPVTFASERT